MIHKLQHNRKSTVTMFYHLHVPKTGGTSISQYFKNHNIRCGGGYGQHRPFLKHNISRNAKIITALRCPIRRILSLYTSNLRLEYGSQNPKKGSPKWLSVNHTFSEWLRISDSPINWTSYVEWFGNSKDDVMLAIRNIESIHHVIDTKYLIKQFNEQITSKYSLPKFGRHSNKSRHSIDVSDEDIAFIKSKIPGDFEICKWFNIEVTKSM